MGKGHTFGGGTGAGSLRVRCDTPQSHLLPPVGQEAGDTLTGGGGPCELGDLMVEEFRGNGVQCRAEVHKQDPSICPWGLEVTLHHPPTCLPSRKTAGGQAEVL